MKFLVRFGLTATLVVLVTLFALAGPKKAIHAGSFTADMGNKKDASEFYQLTFVVKDDGSLSGKFVGEYEHTGTVTGRWNDDDMITLKMVNNGRVDPGISLSGSKKLSKSHPFGDKTKTGWTGPITLTKTKSGQKPVKATYAFDIQAEITQSTLPKAQGGEAAASSAPSASSSSSTSPTPNSSATGGNKRP